MTALSVILLILIGVVACDEQSLSHYNIILMGATGDLAKKYLWSAMFEFFQMHYEKGKTHFSIYACGLSSPDKGRKTITDILLFTITCKDGNFECKAAKTKFVEAIQYNQLKTEEHYIELGEKISENTMSLYGTLASRFSYEQGRMIYLAIPPSAYSKTIRLVDYHLRPRIGRPWVRLILEKPFGTDLLTATDLSVKLNRYFQQQEIYLVDHYLGKTTVKSIMPFRYMNKELLEEIWNGKHIERVEIVLKETVDATSHIKFYEETGVVRDMLQSHAMNLLTLIACDLPLNSANIQQILDSRKRLLSSINVLQQHNIVYGQYSTFAAEVFEQLQRFVRNSVPTFAAAILSINSNRWRGVPFILVSGKKLDKKASYVKVVFKNNAVCISRKNCGYGGEIVFNVGGINAPSISVSKSLGQPVIPNGWRLTIESEENNRDDLILHPISDSNAYITLFDAVFNGQRHLFVDIPNILLSWQIWSDIISSPTISYRNYTGGKDGCNVLDFRLNADHPEFIFTLHSTNLPEEDYPNTFRDQSLITGSETTVIKALVSSITNVISDIVQLQGICHIAFAGGQTMKSLIHLIAQQDKIQWPFVHVWQVDERCTFSNNSERNFHLLEPLLQIGLVPLQNLHLMPIELESEPCAFSDKADIIYETYLKRYIPNGIIDVLILGVGEDGHIASLFPNHSALNINDRWVAFADSVPAKSSRRLTLTYPILNKAQYTALLILGSKKQSIVKNLSSGIVDRNIYPVTGLSNAQLYWHIDNSAFNY